MCDSGWRQHPKQLPPHLVPTTALAAELFEQITNLPEYLPNTRRTLDTREPRAGDHRGREVRHACRTWLRQLGKDPDLARRDGRGPDARTLCPLRRERSRFFAAQRLRSTREYAIPVTAVVGDFHRHLQQIPNEGSRLIVFLGGTIGNLTPQQRNRFLVDLEATMDHRDWLLLGTDP